MSNTIPAQQSIIGVKELRENLEKYIMEIEKGKSFTVVRRSRPVFSIGPILDDENEWETVADFTNVKKGGVPLKEILARL